MYVVERVPGETPRRCMGQEEQMAMVTPIVTEISNERAHELRREWQLKAFAAAAAKADEPRELQNGR
jgi:hypothetical protein